jgi:putative tricarboxylic transport membrane protein
VAGVTAATGRDWARLADLAGLGVILAIILAAGARAWGYGLWLYGEPGPGLFPLVACAVTGAFALVAMVALAVAPPVREADPDEGAPTPRRLAIYLATILTWPWLLSPLGFLVSSALAFVVLLRWAEGVRWRTTILLLAGALLASWLLFDRLLGVPLPRGTLLP